MFVLISVEDNIVVEPKYFGKEIEAISQEIRVKYVNKVIKDSGLIISLYDITNVGDSFVYPGEGAARVKVYFRLVAFRPFVGEVIEGRIKASNEEGLQVSLDFFEDIYVPPNLLQHPKLPSTFDEGEQLWYWKYQEHQLYMELNMNIRFRVERYLFPSSLESQRSVIFNDRASKRPPLISEANREEDTDSEPAPMGAVNESGLGSIQWWKNNQES